MSKELRIGLWMLFVGLLAVGLIAGMAMAERVNSLRYTVTFSDAEGLQKGDRVMLGGVRIGEVDFVELRSQPTRVDVRLKIDAEHAAKVMADSTAIIASDSLVNVSGQKVVNIVNPEGDAPLAPMPKNAEIEGMDGQVELSGWKLRRKLSESKDVWARRLDGVQESMGKSLQEVQELAASPQVKETMGKLGDFVKQMGEQGANKAKELGGQWDKLKLELQPALKELSEFGREYIVDQIKRIMEQIELTLKQWSGGSAADDDAATSGTP